MPEILANLLSRVLALVGSTLLLPVLVACHYREWPTLPVFVLPMAASWLLAGLFRLRTKRQLHAPHIQNAFVIVGGVWIAISLFGAIPLWACGAFASYTDAVFESVSGFTTTGASVLSDVESLPHCINFWRCQTHWLGGMGVIALVVAVMPSIGMNGFSLIKAESSGPDKGRLTSRIRDTAKVLWLIYFAMTVAQTALLHLAGMGWFDATCHAFSTMGTGGFSTRNASVGAFATPSVDWICTAFMLMASVNFSCYYLLFTGRFSEFFSNTELRGFLLIVVTAIFCCTCVECFQFGSFSESLRLSAFQVASIISTTGFMTSDYTLWLPAAQLIILAMFIVGGCSGSTAGGVKVIRWAVLWKQLRNDLNLLLHPHGVFTLRINGTPGREGIVPTACSFIFVYFALVMVAATVAACFGIDMLTALTSALSMAGNVGPAFGTLGPAANYGALPDAVKWVYAATMLAGRLEIYTLLLMVGRSFHRSK